MAWEQRGGRRYYYRAQKVGGRVLKECAGSGLLGELAEAEDLARRAQIEEQRRELRQVTRDTAGDADLFEELEREIARALHAAGLHRPKRGKWRRKR